MTMPIEALVERSSLGTRQARAARRSVSSTDAAAILARSKTHHPLKNDSMKLGAGGEATT
jgi:hypothetical protein